MQEALSHRSQSPALPFSEFLTALLRALEKQGVRYCILRNYDEFPLLNAGNDLDFLIARTQLPGALAALRSVQGARAVGYLERASVALVHMAGIAPRRGVRGVEVDYDLSLAWKGLPFIATKTVLQAAILRQAEGIAFYVPSAVHEAIISLLANLLVGGFLKERYLPKVQQIFAGNGREVVDALLPHFGLKAATQLVDAVVSGDRREMMGCISSLRASLVVRCFLRKPIRSTLAIVRHFRHEIAIRISGQTLQTVGVFGPDAGVITRTVDALMPMIQFCAAEVGRFRFGNSYRFKPRRNLSLHIYESAGNDAESKGNREPKNFAELVRNLPSSFDLCLLLDASPGNLQSKKEEVLRSKARIVILDASQPLDRIAEDAYAAIIDTLAERTDRTMKNCL
jgi:hypothetical protein